MIYLKHHLHQHRLSWFSENLDQVLIVEEEASDPLTIMVYLKDSAGSLGYVERMVEGEDTVHWDVENDDNNHLKFWGHHTYFLLSVKWSSDPTSPKNPGPDPASASSLNSQLKL